MHKLRKVARTERLIQKMHNNVIMVNLLEYEGKALFKKYNIRMPAGKVIHNEKEVPAFKKEKVLKAQVPTGHRGKNGGVVIVKDSADARNAIKTMKKINFDGFFSKDFLLEDKVKHPTELYLSIALDRSKRAPVLLASDRGGVNIEEIPKENIFIFTLISKNNSLGITNLIEQELFTKLNLEKDTREAFYELIDSMWRLYQEEDAELVEINPLAVLKNGFIALDSKIVIDDDALFRHPDIKVPLSTDPLELAAKKQNMSFVRLGGDIGLIANGAGLTMATIDMIAEKGGTTGDFLDLGGTDDPKKVAAAVGLIANLHPKALLINIFGGVTKADTVAEGIVAAVDSLKPDFRIFVRLSGFGTEKGKETLRKKDIDAYDGADEAINAVVSYTRKSLGQRGKL